MTSVAFEAFGTTVDDLVQDVSLEPHGVLECPEHLGARTTSWLLVVRMFEMHDCVLKVLIPCKKTLYWKDKSCLFIEIYGYIKVWII